MDSHTSRKAFQSQRGWNENTTKSRLQRNASKKQELKHPKINRKPAKATKHPNILVKLQSISISLAAATSGTQSRARNNWEACATSETMILSRLRYNLANSRAPAVAQLVQHPRLGFSSGHDPWVVGWSPASPGLHAEWFSLSLSVSDPPCSCALPLKSSKQIEAPGWLSQLRVQLQLRSWPRGSWVPARHQLCADSSEPGACVGFCVPLTLSAPPLLVLCLCLQNKR